MGRLVVVLVSVFLMSLSQLAHGQTSEARINVTVSIPEADDAVVESRISACKLPSNANRLACKALSANSSSSQRQVNVVSSNSSNAFINVAPLVLERQPDQAALAVGNLLLLSSAERAQLLGTTVESSSTPGEVRYFIASI